LRNFQKIKSVLFAIFTIPSIWVTLEFVRSNLFSGFGWGLLGYSQYKNLYLIQIADIAGAYGISFLIMTINVAILCIISYIKQTKEIPSKIRIILKQVALIIIIPLLLISLTCIYGAFKISQDVEGEKTKISIIQGNIPQNKKWNPKYRHWIINEHLRFTKEAAVQDNPDLIIWSEASFPGRFDRDIDLKEKILTLAKNLRCFLLIGAIVRAKHKGMDPYNSAILISPKGKVIQRYDKLQLVPFSEYVILSKKFPVLRKLAISANLTPGKKYTIFELGNKSQKFATLICFEVLFANLSRNFVRNGANLLINISNDAWYKYSPVSYQQLQALVFRAIENRKNAVRIGNIGISCFISPKGKIYGKIKNKEGKSLLIDGHITQEVIFANSSTTFYAKYGNLFIALCMIISLLGGIKIIKSQFFI